MINLQTIGLNILTEKEKKNFQGILNEYSKKIQHKLKGIESIRVHLKEYNYRGEISDKNKKFSIHISICYSGKSMEADDSDWDLKRTLHKVFRKLEQKIISISREN